jgi:ABC-type transporter Mla subunit MlaD
MTPPKPAGMSSEVKVGILFFLGMGLAIWFTFFVTDFGGTKGEYAIRFRKVSQLKDGDPVTYNGVRVGTVAMVAPDIDLDTGEAIVGVTFTLDNKLRRRVLIGPQSEFRIQLGTLGGATLEIRSPGGEPITPALVDGAWGVDGAGIADAVASVQGLIEDNRAAVNQAITAFGEASAQVRDLVKENRTVVTAALGNVSRASDQIAGLVAENRETVKGALANIGTMSGQIAALVEENRQDVKAAMAALPATVKHFGDASKRVEELLAENQADLRRAIENVASFAPKLDRIGTNLEVITTQIAEGRGTIGKLVMDDQLHDKAVSAADNLNNRLEEVKPFTSGITELKLYAGLYGGNNIHTGVQTAHAYLRLEPRPWKFYQAGASYRSAPSDRNVDEEAEDEDLPINFDLMLGWRFFPNDEDQYYHLSLAAGIIESKPGAMAWVPIFGRSLTAVGMIRQKDSSKNSLSREFEEGAALARVSLEYRPWEKYGIWLSAGADDLIDDVSPWIGVRAEILDNDLRNLTQVSSFAP